MTKYNRGLRNYPHTHYGLSLLRVYRFLEANNDMWYNRTELSKELCISFEHIKSILNVLEQLNFIDKKVQKNVKSNNTTHYSFSSDELKKRKLFNLMSRLKDK